MAEYQKIMKTVSEAVQSYEKCVQNSAEIFSALTKENPFFISSALDAIKKDLLKKDAPPVSKFFSLYLLVKASESKSQTLINVVASDNDLVMHLMREAEPEMKKPPEERGANFFPNNSIQQNKIIGMNYIRLLHEAIVYWRKTFQNNMIKTMYDNLKKKGAFPEVFAFIGKQLDPSKDIQTFNYTLVEEETMHIDDAFEKEKMPIVVRSPKLEKGHFKTLTKPNFPSKYKDETRASQTSSRDLDDEQVIGGKNSPTKYRAQTSKPVSESEFLEQMNKRAQDKKSITKINPESNLRQENRSPQPFRVKGQKNFISEVGDINSQENNTKSNKNGTMTKSVSFQHLRKASAPEFSSFASKGKLDEKLNSIHQDQEELETPTSIEEHNQNLRGLKHSLINVDNMSVKSDQTPNLDDLSSRSNLKRRTAPEMPLKKSILGDLQKMQDNIMRTFTNRSRQGSIDKSTASSQGLKFILSPSYKSLVDTNYGSIMTSKFPAYEQLSKTDGSDNKSTGSQGLGIRVKSSSNFYPVTPTEIITNHPVNNAAMGDKDRLILSLQNRILELENEVVQLKNFIKTKLPDSDKNRPDIKIKVNKELNSQGSMAFSSDNEKSPDLPIDKASPLETPGFNKLQGHFKESDYHRYDYEPASNLEAKNDQEKSTTFKRISDRRITFSDQNNDIQESPREENMKSYFKREPNQSPVKHKTKY